MAYILLADGNPFSHMGRNLRGGSSGVATSELLMMTGVLAVVGVVIWLLVRHFNARDQVGYRNPRALFQELCTAHQLDRPQRRVLKLLARQHGLDQPARLFLEPDRYESRYMTSMSPEKRDTLVKLRNQFFSAPSGTETPQEA